VIVKVSSRSPSTGQMLMELSRYVSIIPGLQGFSSLIQIVYGAEANQFLCTHPGIHAVSFVGQSKHFQSIISMAMLSNKKIQLSGSAKNCALLLKDFDFVQYGSDLLESIYTASNGLTWSTTRILALESERFRVIDFLRESMSTLRVTEMPDTSLPWTPGVVRSQAKSHDQMMNYLNQALDNGGYIIGTAAKDFELKAPTTKQKNDLYTNERGAGFFIGVDVSQCAEVQHEPLQTPLVLVNFVKYQFDLAKWVNNSYLGLGASVWGGQEGFQKIADQLDVSYVRHNKWMPPCSARLLGRRQSVFGMTSLEVKGSFFSNVKVLD
jgi:acyl-CoA reductase-like NAD-dependent aldehyde dehydrogenase